MEEKSTSACGEVGARRPAKGGGGRTRGGGGGVWASGARCGCHQSAFAIKVPSTEFKCMRLHPAVPMRRLLAVCVQLYSQVAGSIGRCVLQQIVCYCAGRFTGGWLLVDGDLR
jgi:hypothetical protein